MEDGDGEDWWMSLGAVAQTVVADASARRAEIDVRTAKVKERRRQRRRRLSPWRVSSGRPSFVSCRSRRET